MRRRITYARKRRGPAMRGRARAPWKGIKNIQSWSQYTKYPFARNVAITKHSDYGLLTRAFKPPSTFCIHRYVEEVNLSQENITGLTGSEYAFRLNSLFDPNFTGVGHQPRGFDQMAALYANYCVYKVQVQIRLMSQSGGINQAQNFLVCNVRPYNNGSYALGPARRYGELMESPTNTIITMESDAENQNKTWEQTYWIADIEGIPRGQIYQDDTFKSIPSASPNKTPFFSCAVGSINEQSGGYVRFAVSFAFHTLWSEPLLVGQS